ncbi:MAG: glycosyltransferase [Bacteroidetes bacterium]|nr:glycosyltransferase [Bacteroidota bacterium]
MNSKTTNFQNHPLVSVGITTYNHEKFIAETIESVLNQVYPNVELVIRDDKSSDNTAQIVQEYQKRFPERIRFEIATTNEGPTKNINHVLRECSGTYFALLDGDDLMYPDKLSRQVDLMESNLECAICYHNMAIWDSDSRRNIGTFNSSQKYFEGDVRTSIMHGTFNCGSSNMVRMAKVPPHGFDSRVTHAPDWLFWVQILATGGTINYIDEVLGVYRRHPGNMTHFKRKQLLMNHILSICIIMKELPRYIPHATYRLVTGVLNQLSGKKYE